MAVHDQLSLPPMAVPNTVQPRTPAGPSGGPVGVPERTDGLSLLMDGVKDAPECSEKEIYLSLGLPDHSYWGKVKSGEKPAPRINKLTDLPDPVQRAMCKRWARQLRMDIHDQDAQRAAIVELAESAVRVLRIIA